LCKNKERFKRGEIIMSKKNNTVTTEGTRVYPIKVRLIKPNPANQDKVVYNNIELYTYKDTVIESIDEFAKIIPMQKYLVIKSDVVESQTEVSEDNTESPLVESE
jgi:ribosomal protein S3AE